MTRKTASIGGLSLVAPAPSNSAWPKRLLVDGHPASICLPGALGQDLGVTVVVAQFDVFVLAAQWREVEADVGPVQQVHDQAIA